MKKYSRVKFENGRTEVWHRVYASDLREDRIEMIDSAIERGFLPKKKYQSSPPVDWPKKVWKEAIGFEIARRIDPLDNPSGLRAAIRAQLLEGEAPKKGLSVDLDVLLDKVMKGLLAHLDDERHLMGTETTLSS